MVDVEGSIVGSPDELARQLAPQFERTILELVVEGFERWKADGYKRYSDREEALTVRLLACMRQVCRERNLPFRVAREQYEDSPAVLAGEADPLAVPRIDIAVWWDQLAEVPYFTVECKRLADGELVREYVREGVLRFVSGKYAGIARVGGMVGYVVVNDPTQLWHHVNREVQRHPVLGVGHRLTPSDPIRGLSTVYTSRHQRSGGLAPIKLTHLFFDVRLMPPSTSAAPVVPVAGDV